MRCFTKKWKYPTGYRENGKWHSNRIYYIWNAMKNRCTNSKCRAYKWYGGRGISVCEEWLSYDCFYEWVQSCGEYSEDLTLDRIDVNGNYEPKNCRWVKMEEQLRNRRDTIKIDDKCLYDIAKESGIPLGTVRNRYYDGKDLTEEKRRYTKRVCDGKPLKLISEETGIPISTLIYRWNKGKRSYNEITEGRRKIG